MMMMMIYESAVLKESLRLAYGSVTPLPRIVSPVDAKIGDARVPAGVRTRPPISSLGVLTDTGV